MPGLVPGIHALPAWQQERRGWPGRSPAMTKESKSLKRGSEGVIPMKRVLVFMLLGPTLVVTAWLIYFAESGGGSGSVAAIVSMLLFLFTLIVAMITWAIDGSVAHTLLLPLRAPLTAIVGGIVAFGVFLGMVGWMFPLWTSTPFAIGGAVCTGVCSLLSHDYGRWQRRAVQRSGLPSSAG
jgi:hypothetical protein